MSASTASAPVLLPSFITPAVEQELLTEAIRLRRLLHHIAEPSLSEHQTQQAILNEVQSLQTADQTELKISFLPDKSIPGAMITLRFKPSGRHAALRCDLDGLTIQESTDSSHLPARAGFNCKTGCMHACGHDGHMAIALTLLKFLARHPELMQSADAPAALSFIFQGAEEGCQGARYWVESGLLQGIEDLYCFHLGMGLPDKTCAPAADGFLATLKFDLTVHGRTAHAGRPRDGINALTCLCTLITMAQELLRPERGEIINFGTLHCEGARNIIPALASAQGELRAPAADTLKGMQERLDDLISAVAAAFPGSRIECVKCGFGLPIQADPALAQQLGRAAAAAGLTLQPQFDFKASEDASLLIKAVQDHGGRGVYSVFGAHLAAGHHQSTFDFNEDALLGAIKTYLTLFTGAAGAAA